MKTKLNHHLPAALFGIAFTTTLQALLLSGLLLAGAPFPLRAQLVPDGGTSNVTSVVNLAGGLVVGNTGGNTTLNIIAPGAVNDTAGTIGLNASSSNNKVSVQDSGASWSNTGDLYVGNQGSANLLVISNGAAVVNNFGVVGYTSSSDDNLAVVSGSGSSWNGFALWLGSSGSGNQLLVSNGGRVGAQASFLGLNSGSDDNLAVISGAGSRWTNNTQLSVGYSGSGNRLVVSNAATVAASTVDVGFLSSSLNNRMIVDGGTLRAIDALDIRRGTNLFNAGLIRTGNLLLTNTAGRFEFNGGTLITGGATIDNGQPFVVGLNAGPESATWIASNATHQIANQLHIGWGAPNASLLITFGSVVTSAGNTYAGFNAASSNSTVQVTGTGATLDCDGNTYIGNFSSGNTLLINNGGTATSVFTTTLGLDPGSRNNQIVVSGGGSQLLPNTWTVVGWRGSENLLLITNGASVRNGFNGYVGYHVEASNNLAVVTGSGSAWTNNGPLVIGRAAPGNELRLQDNGRARSGGATILGELAGSMNNLLHLDGGVLDVGTTLDVRRGTLQLDSGTATVGTLQAANGADGAIVFNGGTLSVGASTVNNGEPLVVGNGSSAAEYQLTDNGLHTFNNGVTLANNATLSGNGTVTGVLTVQAGGSLAPGTSVGGLVLNNSPVLQGTVIMEISKTGVTPTNDLIQVAGPVTYGGTLTVTDLGPDPLADGDTFKLFEATSYGGGFSSVLLPPLDPSLMWTNKLLVDGSIAVVPTTEPFYRVAIAGLPRVDRSSVAWGDYDNDGRLDFLITGADGGANVSQLWRNTGSGFTNVPVAGLSGGFGSSAAWGDYDNDGRLDFLITGNFISQLWRNTGSGFANVPIAGLPGMYSGSVAWGDYDNDGRLDFLLTGENGFGSASSQLWRNTGSGFANTTATVAPGLPGVDRSSVAWGDYDNDGRLDFLMTGAPDGGASVSQLWRNTGSGFTNVPIAGLPAVWISSVAWGDYDNDGRLDFLLTGLTNNLNSSAASQLWRNTGSGFTHVPIAGLPEVYSGSVAWGDYDNDSRLDFLIAGRNFGRFTQLWRNNTPVTNTPPGAPTGLALTATTNAVMLSWNSATDDFTPAPGLTYNVRAGSTPGGIDLFAGHVDATNGFRRVPAMGNAMLRHSLPLTGLTNGQTVYWSVQAVDTAFAGGPFATETSVVTIPTLTITRSDTASAVVSWSPPTLGWRLQEAPDFKVQVWENSASGEENPVIVPSTNSTKFYRLVNP